MKINQHYKLRRVTGENVIVRQGREGTDLTTILTPNDTSCFLFDSLEGRDFTARDVEELLLSEYEIDEETVARDTQKWISSLRHYGILED